MDDWTVDYVGIPWEWRGRTRTGLDCYGLVRLVYEEQCGIGLPEEQYLTGIEAAQCIGERKADWNEVADPDVFDVAILEVIGRDPVSGELTRGPHHLGIYRGEGEMLECREPVGVIVQPVGNNVVEWLRAA